MKRWIFIACLVQLLHSATAFPAEYQWSVPMPKSPTGERRAYLWIPPACQHVRGLIIGLQNMLEKPMFEDATIRQAATDSSLGIVWIAPGAEGKGTPLGLDFSPREEAVTVLQQTLAALAQESGYGEVEFAPLLAVGHSAATPFVWGMGEWDPARVFAIIPNKGWYPAHAPRGVPVFRMAQEWTEWGDKWGEDWLRRECPAALSLRADGDAALVGEFLDAGAGHFDWTPEAAKVVALFIRKAAQYRLPETGPATGPVKLKPIDFRSGCLIDALKLGTPQGKAIAVRDWAGDTKAGLWYFDRELADAVNDYARERLAKKPQMIDFMVNGQPAPLVKNGFADFTPKLLSDGVTFKVAAAFLDESPTTNLFSGQKLGHAAGPIRFRVGSGGLRQISADTFQVAVDRGSVARQGPPWEPWVIAYSPGDADYRPADRPAHAFVATRLTEGKPQTITFPEIPDQKLDGQHVQLGATSDSGLPVQYLVISGPVELQGDELRFTTIPRRAKLPIRVCVAAYQWGRGIDPKIQSTGPVVRRFLIGR
ncbi:MAG TPA: hypothetical protein VF988_05390 [Verrucomicrobiae bacterium]